MSNIKEMSLEDLENKFSYYSYLGMVDVFADMFWTEFSQKEIV